MPDVNIKGIGKARFPDSMGADEIRSFLVNKYPQPTPEQAQMTHGASTTPIQQTAKEFPKLADYAADVASGKIANEGVARLADLASRAQAGDNAAGEELIGEFGFGGITKVPKAAKPWYHGTRDSFDSFDAKEAGKNTPGIDDEVIFFDRSKDEAKFYTEAEDLDYNVRSGDTPRIVQARLDESTALNKKTGEYAANYYDRNRGALIAEAEREGSELIIIKGKNGTEIAAVLNDRLIEIQNSIPVKWPRK